jgi:hypothetical protein
MKQRSFTMNRKIVKAGLLAVAVTVAIVSSGGASAAAQFSADVVDLQADGSARKMGESGKLFVSGDMIRIDRADASGTRFLVDADKPTAYVVAPAERVYMESKQSSILTELFVPLDPAAPCSRIETMAKLAGDSGKDGGSEWRCDQPASVAEDIDGRPAAKLTMTSPSGEKRTAWMDKKLNFLVKIETAGGAVIALRNIVEAPQPSSLFTLPDGVRKFDPETLLARVKQSDAWVEPVK